MLLFQFVFYFFLKERQIIITRVAKELRREQSISYLLDDSNRFKPVCIEELSYQII